MTFRVETSARAKRDLDAILTWLLEQQAGETGLRWFEGLCSAVDSLGVSPRRCGMAPEDESLPYEVRQLFYENDPHVYRILFTVEGQTVTVLHIRHGRRPRLGLK